MKKSFLLFFICLTVTIYAQTDEVYTKVDQMPEFPGGQVAMVKYISKNLKYPELSKKNRISGKVLVSFIIDKTGKVTNAKVAKGISADCDSEALRVVQNMPVWTPGYKGGQPVAVHFALPINFELNE
jgi:periplasmic protein TonB